MKMRPTRSSNRLVVALALLAVVGCAAPRQAWATWSIVAVDERTGEVGSAGVQAGASPDHLLRQRFERWRQGVREG